MEYGNRPPEEVQIGTRYYNSPEGSYPTRASWILEAVQGRRSGSRRDGEQVRPGDPRRWVPHA